MLGSKSTYFFKTKSELQLCRLDLIAYLQIWKYSQAKIDVYLRAFDYMCKNPGDFDGATVVKDLYHIPKLDINAMLHDFHCVAYNAACNFYVKWYADKLYAKEMERLGKGQLAWLNFGLLKLIGVPHVIYAYCKRGGITLRREVKFFEDYRILMN